MAFKLDRPCRQSTAPFLGLVVLMAAGCGESEQIRTYTVPKEPKVEVAAVPRAATVAEAPTAKQGEPTDRMLVAVLPADGQAYFFKIVGPIAVIDKREKQLNEFFTTVRIGEDGKPAWNLPEEWKDGPGNAMRLATILVPSEPKPLELTVNMSRWDGSPADTLLNINRWRGQLQLPPTTESQISESTRQEKAGDRVITIVDLRGRFSGVMMPPFAGGGARPLAPGTAPNLPPGHPPVEPNQTAPPATSNQAPAPGVPKFTAPADWKQLPAGGMQVAAFSVGAADKRASVTIIPFSLNSGPSIADPLQNTNMWRGAVGLPPIKQDELTKHSESIEIEGKPAIYVRVVPDPAEPSQSQAKEATLAAMAKTGDQIWFIKFKGDRGIVTAQEDAFKTFLKSLRFAADRGATDGNK